jgi:serine/threonine protein kinase
MVDRIACPESARLPRLLRDDGRDDEPLAGHLARCARCQDALERLAVGAAEWLRGDREEPADRPESLRATLDALKALAAADGPPAPAETPDAVGPYPVLAVVGRGGMGVVYEALDPSLNRVIAVKVLAPEWSANGTARQRFLREARAAAAVAHDNVVTIHAVEGEGDPPYLVMEYVSGVSLQERIDRDGPLSPADAARVGLQTADGLAAAHSQGLVHRDVKPANILIENGVGRVKLSDFGLARAADNAGWTAHGTVLGTPEYMAPEQAAGEAIDARADLFGLGCVLYAALTGLPPFRASSALGVLHRVTTAAPRPVRAINPDVPAALEEVVMKLLAKNPVHRYASAADTAEAFRRALVRMQLPAPARPPRGRRWLVAAGFAALLLLAARVVFKFPTGSGTLVVEIDDPANSAKVEKDGDAVVITGVGVHEVRLKPGDYRATKVGPGGAAAPEVVTIERDGRTVLKVRFEPTAPAQIAPAPPAQPIPANPTPLRTFEGHTGTVQEIVLLPDGKGFVSSSGWPNGDGTIRVWDYVTGKTARAARPRRQHRRARRHARWQRHRLRRAGRHDSRLGHGVRAGALARRRAHSSCDVHRRFPGRQAGRLQRPRGDDQAHRHLDRQGDPPVEGAPVDLPLRALHAGRQAAGQRRLRRHRADVGPGDGPATEVVHRPPRGAEAGPGLAPGDRARRQDGADGGRGGRRLEPGHRQGVVHDSRLRGADERFRFARRPAVRGVRLRRPRAALRPGRRRAAAGAARRAELVVGRYVLRRRADSADGRRHAAKPARRAARRVHHQDVVRRQFRRAAVINEAPGRAPEKHREG